MSHTILMDRPAVSHLEGSMIMGSRTKDNVDVGSKAPNFTLPSQSGELVSFRDSLGEKAVVLFFYPKDDTPGCTKEACAFRDEYGFCGLTQELCREAQSSLYPTQRRGGEVRRLYGVPNTFGLFAGRVTYVIDQEGIVRHVFSSQIGVERHVREALEALHSIS